MARARNTLESALPKGAMTVLFCLVDDAYPTLP